jgi:hypothetical protein
VGFRVQKPPSGSAPEPFKPAPGSPFAALCRVTAPFGAASRQKWGAEYKSYVNY